jgi:membrane protein
MNSPEWLSRLKTRARDYFGHGALRDGWEVLRRAIDGWVSDKAPMHAAAIAYYTTFSIAPMLVICTAVASAIFGEEAARGEVREQLSGLMGDSAARSIEDVMSRSGVGATGGVLPTVLGVVALVLGATGVFVQLQESLNAVMKVEPLKLNGIVSLLRARLISFAMVLAIGFVLLVSLIVSAGLSAFGKWTSGIVSQNEFLLQSLNMLVSVAVISGLFAVMFKFLPDRRPKWADVWPGALVTAALFSLGKFFIGLYLGKASIASTWGGLGSLAVLLVWVYFSSYILLLGAEITHALAERHDFQTLPPRRGGTTRSGRFHPHPAH